MTCLRCDHTDADLSPRYCPYPEHDDDDASTLASLPSPALSPRCLCGSPPMRHRPHLVSPISTPPSTPLRTPMAEYFDALDDPEDATANSLMAEPVLLPPSLHAVTDMTTVAPPSRSLADMPARPPFSPWYPAHASARSHQSTAPIRPLFDLLCAQAASVPSASPPAPDSTTYSLLNSRRDVYDSAYGAADVSPCPTFCWVCHPDASVPRNMESLDHDDALRYIARIAGHGNGVFADGLLLALSSRV